MNIKQKFLQHFDEVKWYWAFSHDVTVAILVLVYQGYGHVGVPTLGVEFFSYATTFFSSKSAYMLATWVNTLYHALYWKLGGLFTLYSWVKRISVFDSEKSYFTLYANWNDCARSSKRLILTFDMTFVQSKLFIEVRWFSFRK